MVDLSAFAIFLGSFIGIIVILFRKIPFLAELPEQKIRRQLKFFNILKKGIGNNSFLKTISLETFLQKILSKIRVLTLKMESKIGFWLQRLREKSQKKKIKEKDNYWEKIRKTGNGR